jgi:hypothetical protein
MYLRDNSSALLSVGATLQHLEVGHTSRLPFNSTTTMSLQAGSLSGLRTLGAKQQVDEKFLLILLKATTDNLEEFYLTEDYCQMKEIADCALAFPSLASIKRTTFFVDAKPHIYPWAVTRNMPVTLSHMTALEELEIGFWHNDLRMDFFICHFMQMKEDGCLPNLKLLKLIKGLRKLHHRQYSVEESICTTPTALLLLLWLHEEANGCARGLRVPYIPLPRSHILFRMLQAARGDEVGKGVKTWHQWKQC